MDLVNILKNNNKYCSGCGACMNVCPCGAIQMKSDKWGFLYPSVDSDKCVSCNLCTKSCPKINSDSNNMAEPECYAAAASDDIRKVSSSGGIFTLLAKYVLSKNGVVCGATMGESYDVKHILITSLEELPLLQKSKYVQSNTGFIYKQAIDALRDQKMVLFSGTPCQVAAMNAVFKAYSNKWGDLNADNLLLVDILCHGVPSSQMLKDYISENFDESRLTGIDFRSKINGWRADQITVFWNDGTSDVIEWHNSAYEEGFQRNICLRDGCNECEFCGIQRQGDITIGDFWQVEKYDKDLNDKLGTSVVLINNTKGEEIFNCIKDSLVIAQKTPISAARHNRLKTTFSSHPMRERFFDLYPKRSFTDSVMQCRHALYDIGLVGNYMVGNYGGALTQYALYRTLGAMGYSVLMIERPADAINPPRKNLNMFLSDPYKSWDKSRIFANIAEMKFLNQQCKVFVTGSDQMFNNNLYNWYGKIQAQNFVTDAHRKIAYAASFGHDYIWGSDSDRADEAFYLQRFDAFSVREDSGVDVCKKYFGIHATWVLDPVFLADINIYQELASRANSLDAIVYPNKGELEFKNYLFTYMLDPDDQAQKIVESIANKNHLIIKAVGDNIPTDKRAGSNWTIPTQTGITVEEWLHRIINSDFVVTDSFHGMCFSIIFNKQFIVLVNKRRGESRFTSLLRLLNLQDHMVYDFNQMEQIIIDYPVINYEEVKGVLKQEITRCKSWLVEAIEKDKEQDVSKAMSTYDITDARIDELWKHSDQKSDEISRKTDNLSQVVIELQNMVNKLSDDNQKLVSKNNQLSEELDKVQERVKGIYSSKVLAVGRCLHRLLSKFQIWK